MSSAFAFASAVKEEGEVDSLKVKEPLIVISPCSSSLEVVSPCRKLVSSLVKCLESMSRRRS